MSSTTTSAVRVKLFPAPPPTNNTLDREERSRLLRSTRKLGAVLGTTPLLLEPESESASQPTAKSAGKRVVRREGRVFHSPSSSISSEETLAISPEPDYVFVKSNTRSSPYQVQAVFDNASPSSSRCASPPQGPTSGVGARVPVSRNLKRKQGQETVLAPITIMFPLPGSSGSKQTHSGSSSGSTSNKEKGKSLHPSQPLLLRFRPGPAQPNDRRIKPDSHSNSPSQPLSPASSTFNMNVDLVPPSPMLPSMDSGSNGLSDKEKRRKMAKLTRTLGENIPPELVFRAPSCASPPSSTAPALSSSSPAQVSRRTSLSISRPHNLPSMTLAFDPFHKPSKRSATSKSSQSTATASAPPLAVAAAPTPAPSPSPPPSPSERPSTDKTTKRRHRPRSLTLGSSSAFAAATATLGQREREPTRGTASLEVQPSPSLVQPVRQSHEPQPSPRPFEAQGQVQEKEKLTHGASLSIEFGRRKEREWSGEWNLKDMEDVAKKLRGLKGR